MRGEALIRQIGVVICAVSIVAIGFFAVGVSEGQEPQVPTHPRGKRARVLAWVNVDYNWKPNGKYNVALTNFCKLQSLGPDDHDDMLSCLSFLFVDVVAARQLLAEFV